MKKRNVIEENAIVVFERSIKASELNKLTNNFYGDVIITKKLIVDTEIDISCNLYIVGDIVRKYPISQSDININGDFWCYGEMHCHNVRVSGCFFAKKIIYSKNIRVRENFSCDDKVDAYGCSIIVAGDMECYDVISKSVECLGKINVHGSISVTAGMKNYMKS